MNPELKKKIGQLQVLPAYRGYRINDELLNIKGYSFLKGDFYL